MLLNKHLQPRMLNLALDITGLNHDDLFYYKNKPRIDQVGLTFQQRAKETGSYARVESLLSPAGRRRGPGEVRAWDLDRRTRVTAEEQELLQEYLVELGQIDPESTPAERAFDFEV